LPVIDDRNTIRHEVENHGVTKVKKVSHATTASHKDMQNALQALGVNGKAVPAGKILVLQEIAQYCDISEGRLHGVMGMSQPSGVGITWELESLDESVVYREVEDGIQCSRTLVL